MYRNQTWDFEFVFNIDNDSGCELSFTDSKRNWQKVRPSANAMTFLKAQSSTHCAVCTPGTKHRTILKFIYTGDLRKAGGFQMYTENDCAAGNPNVDELERRRAQQEL